jgi:DNA-binding CsgD family transcriptional regulator
VLATRALDQLLARRSGEWDLAVTLTPRELEVARLIAQGFSNKAVAAKLLVTEGTVKLHVHHVYEKLKVEGRMARRLPSRQGAGVAMGAQWLDLCKSPRKRQAVVDNLAERAPAKSPS